MTAGPHLTIWIWLAALSPVAVLLATIIALRWSAVRSAGLAWLLALGIAWFLFRAGPLVLASAAAKGISLSIFVLLIIWSGVFLYNVVDQLGAIQIIGARISRLAADPLLRSLLIAWAFSGFIQGISGFGVPIAVALPLMLFAGFVPAAAAMSVMIGHSWAITFGSMASSYFAILIVTGVPEASAASTIAAMFAVPILLTGLAVLHINGGMDGLRRAWLPVLAASAVMALSMYLLAWVGAVQIASIVPGLAGIAVISLCCRVPAFRCAGARMPDCISEPASSAASSPPKMSFNMAFLPYYLLIALTILSQVPVLKDAASGLALGLDFPALETGYGFQVAAQAGYAKIRLLNHPAPLIGISLAVAYFIYRRRGLWRKGVLSRSLSKTASRTIRTSVAIALLVMMAVLMTDSGMTTLLAQGIQVTGQGYPLLSSFIGLLGSLITGSNTNSNIMFGALQEETANALGFSALVIVAAQTMGASIGAGVSPDKALIGSSIIGGRGSESELIRGTLPYAVAIVLVIGLECLALVWLTG